MNRCDSNFIVVFIGTNGDVIKAILIMIARLAFSKATSKLYVNVKCFQGFTLLDISFLFHFFIASLPFLLQPFSARIKFATI